MAPIHDAAGGGHLQEVNRLLEQDGVRLMWAADNGRDAVVARLLALGADLRLVDHYRNTAVHRACYCKKAPALALLLAAGAPFNDRGWFRRTPLISAADHGAIECVKLLLARGGDGIELNATDTDGCTALHWSVIDGHLEIISLLLLAGADPTITNQNGETPLDIAQQYNSQPCIPLLKTALAEPQRPRLLLKARALLDASHKIRQARTGNIEQEDDGGLRRSARLAPERNALAAAPAYLKRRVQQNQPLPRVTVNNGHDNDEQLTACVKYALGLESGGGVTVVEGQAPQVGMVKEVFVELCELLVPKWVRKDM